MARTAVRRVNEWDGPSMLKVYTPYTGTPAAPEREAPDLQAYVRRIDRYTYGLGWLLCEIDHQTVGFCHLSEDPAAPEDLFTVEFQLYVKQGMCRRHIGRGAGKAVACLSPAPLGPGRSEAHQALLGGGGRLRGGPGKGRRAGGCFWAGIKEDRRLWPPVFSRPCLPARGKETLKKL